MINGNNKERFLIGILLIMLLTGCGLSDWTYPIKNGYAIWHINSDTIVFGKETDCHTLHCDIEANIIAFAYNDTYVILQTESPDKEFYVVNMDLDLFEGPLNSMQLEGKISEYQMQGLSGWKQTKPAPEGALFPSL